MSASSTTSSITIILWTIELSRRWRTWLWCHFGGRRLWWEWEWKWKWAVEVGWRTQDQITHISSPTFVCHGCQQSASQPQRDNSDDKVVEAQLTEVKRDISLSWWHLWWFYDHIWQGIQISKK
jgi:hypothetical protein